MRRIRIALLVAVAIALVGSPARARKDWDQDNNANGWKLYGNPYVVATVSALEATTGGSLWKDGARVRVQSVRADFVFHASSALTVDHISVASVTGVVGARWIRDTTPDPTWAAQVTWYVDPANVTATASDENDGAGSGTALRTWAEVGRRFAGQVLTATAYTVNLLSDTPDTDPLYLDGVGTTQKQTTFTVAGSTSVVTTGTFSAAHNPASIATVDHYSVTPGVSFTSWLQTYLLHRTSGTSAYAWPYADLGSGVLQTSAPVNNSVDTPLTWAAADTFEVLSLPAFADVFLHGNSRRVFVSIQKVKLIGASVATNQVRTSTVDAALEYRHSIISTSTVTGLSGLPLGSQFTLSNLCVKSTVSDMVLTGHVFFQGGLVAGNGTTSLVQFTGDHGFLGGSGMPVTLGGRRLIFNHFSRGEKLEAMSYDWVGTGVPLITVQLSSWLYLLALGGERNTTQLVWSDRSSQAIMATSTAVAAGATSHGTPFNADGTSFATYPAYSDVALTSLYPFPSAVFETGAQTKLTFGTIADGGFLQRSGTGIVGTTTISGSAVSLTATRVGFGSATNTLTGSTNLIFADGTTGPTTSTLTVGDGTNLTNARLTLNGAAGSASSQGLIFRAGGTLYLSFLGFRDNTATTGFVQGGFAVTSVPGGSLRDRWQVGGSGQPSGTIITFTDSTYGDVAVGGINSGDELSSAGDKGFLWIPRMNGAPSATPVLDGNTGGPRARQAIVLDRVNKRLYWYDSIGATWRYVGMDNGNGASAITSLTTDVVASGPGAAAATIQPDVVTNAKLANMATARFKARVTAGTGDPEDVTGTQATTLLDQFTTSLQGVVPGSGGGTTNFLRADGTWAAPPGSGGTVTNVTATAPITSSGGTTPNIAITIDSSLGVSAGALQRAALTGDINCAAGSNSCTIPNNTVTYAKMQDVSAASRLIGRGSAGGAGDPEELTLGAGLSLSGTTLNSTDTIATIYARGLAGTPSVDNTMAGSTFDLRFQTDASVYWDQHAASNDSIGHPGFAVRRWMDSSVLLTAGLQANWITKYDAYNGSNYQGGTEFRHWITDSANGAHLFAFDRWQYNRPGTAGGYYPTAVTSGDPSPYHENEMNNRFGDTTSWVMTADGQLFRPALFPSGTHTFHKDWSNMWGTNPSNQPSVGDTLAFTTVGVGKNASAPSAWGQFSYDASDSPAEGAGHIEWWVKSTTGGGSAAKAYSVYDDKVVFPRDIILNRSGSQSIEKQGSGALFVGTLGAASTALYTNNTTRLTVDSTGGVTLSSLGSGIVQSTSGLLSNATTASIATALALPSGNRVLGGASTAFVASDEVRLSDLTDEFMIGDGGSFTHRDLSGGSMIGATNYSQVRGFWGTFAATTSYILKTEKGGSGTVQPLVLDGNTSALYLTASGSGGNINMAQSPGNTPGIIASSTRAQLKVDVSVSSAGPLAALGAFKMSSGGTGVQISGSTHMTSSTGINVFDMDSVSYTTTATIDHAATLAIADAPTVSGGGSIANRYSLWTQAGILRNDGDLMANGASSGIGFFGNGPTTIRTITGSRTDGTALTSLLSQLATYGLIIDSTSP